MTKDVQPDRSASPLASVSDEICPKTPESLPDTLSAGLDLPPQNPDADAAASAAADRESFEGFGSFG